MSDWLGLAGRSVVVSGGAGGIGRAICEGLAAVGMRIAILDHDADAAEVTAAEIGERHGVDVLARRCDVTDHAAVETAVEAVLERFAGIDVLVNNAGIGIPRLLVDPDAREELDEDVWDRVVAVNMKGQFLVGQAVARTMVAAGKGVIVNMASESGMEGSAGQSVYAATKAASYNLTRSWAKELGGHGVRVVGIAPGIVEATGLRSEEYERALAYARGTTVERLREGYVDHSSIPLRRAARLTEVADVVVYLASDRASYVHGTTVNVSGGKSR